MTRVDFYILADIDELARGRFSCRLAYKAATAGKRVHIRVPAQAANDLDALLWDYPPEQFLPHARLSAASGHEPVTIGIGDEEPDHHEVLINLGDDIAPFFPHFERASEIVLATQRGAGRDKYRHYRDRGYPLFHHELDDWE